MSSEHPKCNTPEISSAKSIGVEQRINFVQSICHALLFLLIFFAIFDPGNRLFGLKYLLFVLFIIGGILANKKMPINFSLILYIALFSFFIPLFSIYMGQLFPDIGFSPPPQPLLYWPGFLFLILALFLSRNDMYDFFRKAFILSLTLLAFLVIGLFFLAKTGLHDFLSQFGVQRGMFWIFQRDYGGIQFPMIYYTSSPLFIISLSYWSFKCIDDFKMSSMLFFMITFIALFLSGTRNSMILAFFIPYVIFLFFSKKRMLFFTLGVIFAIGLSIKLSAVFSDMFSASNTSNAIKLGYLSDYSLVFNNSWHNIVFGQGLGTFFWVTPYHQYVSTTELSYFEIFRMFGVFLGGLMILMYLMPLYYLWRTKDRSLKYLLVGYLGYLYISILNPYIFSSNGMLVLSFILATIFFKIKKIKIKESSDI